MTLRLASALLGATLLAGCAHYSAAPLTAAADALAPLDIVALSIDAQKIERPYLKPQPIDLLQPLTLNAIAVISVVENPDLKAQRAKAGVADAQAFAAGLLPDPALSANVDKPVAGGDTLLGLGGSIGFDLNAIRTAKVAREAAKAARRQVRLDLAWAEWQTAGAARLQDVRVLALTDQLEVARTGAASAKEQFAAVRRAAGRGDIAASELDSRRQATLDADDKVRTAEDALVTARGELNKQLGLAPDVVIRLAPLRQAIVPPAAETLVAQALNRRLDLAALRAGYDSSEAEVHKAVLEQFPNLSLSLAAARDTAGVYTVGPSVGFTLPIFNGNRGAVRTAKATREQLKAEYEARVFQTRAEITAAVASLATVRSQRAALIAALPELRRYSDATARAAKRGDLAPATAAAAEQALRDRQLTLLQLDQQAAEQTIALELLSGGLSEGWTQ